MRKIGEVTNTQHHAHPLIVCDSQAEYGGWDVFDGEIIDSNVEIRLGGMPACIVDGGQHGHVDVYELDRGRIALVNVDEDVDSATLAAALEVPGKAVGRVAVPSGSLAIGIAYYPLPAAEGDPEPELFIMPAEAGSYAVSANDEGWGWRVYLAPAE